MRFSTYFTTTRLFLLTLTLLACLGCNQDQELTASFQAAGSNRIQLQTVLRHFKNDKNPRKLEAAKFLISEMKYQLHYEGYSIKRYDSLINILSKVPYSRMEELDLMWDSLKKSLKSPIVDDAELECDLQTISSQNLISHIDAAFDAWEKPWAQHMSYGDFCKYILPYKLVTEKPEEWMRPIQERYKKLFKKNSTQQDYYQMCLDINSQLKKDFKIRSFPAIWDLNFNELDRLKSGKCYHATQYTAYVMRSLGVPVVMDFTPYWGNMNGGHEWNALIYNNQPIPFIGSESDPGLTKIDLARQRTRAKVFRRTYSFQKQSLAASTQDLMDIPPLFRSAHIFDVTEEYLPVSTVQVSNLPGPKHGIPLYLCVFNRQQWTPTAWSIIKKGKATFSKMGRDIIYLPMYYQSGELSSAGDPLYLNKEGKSIPLKDDGSKTKLIATRKSPEGPNIIKGQEYELLLWDGTWKSIQKTIASADSIVYKQLPQNALYRISSKDKVTKERIFTINNHQQLWK